MKNSCPFGVCRSVCLYVCPSIFGNSARTAGPIRTGVAPFDASTRRNDVGACHESTGGTWHMPPRRGLQFFFARPWSSNGWSNRIQTCRSHAGCPNLKSVLGVGLLRAM